MPPNDATAARRPGVPLGRVLGIPVFLSPSWLVAMVLVTYSVAPAFSQPGTPGPAHYALAALAAALFAVCVLAHEVGHAVLSLRLGIPIRRITLYLFGGLAEMDRDPPTAGTEYLVAVAGPLVSVFLAGAAAAVAGLTAARTAPHRLATYLALTNAVVGVLNLLPGLPLDGGRVLRAAVWGLTGNRETGTRAAVRGGQAVALVAGAYGVLRLGAGDQYGLFTLLVAVFVWTNASAIGRRSAVLARLGALDVRSLVRPALLVEASLPLAEGLRRAVAAGRRLVVVDAEGVPAAVVSGSALAAVPDRRRPWVSVADVCRVLEAGLVLDAGIDGPRLLELMRATPATEYLVRDPDGAVAGVLSAHDVARALEGGAGVPLEALA
jgi:Zn-dependent protease